MQERPDLADYAIILDERDNVATALVDMPRGEYVLRHSGGTRVITLSKEINAGFKVAVSQIQPGERVYKYGYVIGVAREKIHPGDCIHIHNMASSYSFRSSRHT